MTDKHKGKFSQKLKQMILLTIPVTSCDAVRSFSALCRLKSFYNLASVMQVDLDDVASREASSFVPKKTTAFVKQWFYVISIKLYSQLH